MQGRLELFFFDVDGNDTWDIILEAGPEEAEVVARTVERLVRAGWEVDSVQPGTTTLRRLSSDGSRGWRLGGNRIISNARRIAHRTAGIRLPKNVVKLKR
jgi:hypothetical protein